MLQKTQCEQMLLTWFARTEDPKGRCFQCCLQKKEWPSPSGLIPWSAEAQCCGKRFGGRTTDLICEAQCKKKYPYIHICIYIYIHIYLCLHLYPHPYSNLSYIYIFIYIHTHIDVHIYICLCLGPLTQTRLRSGGPSRASDTHRSSERGLCATAQAADP
uniref:Uncharacterized protein n=1 Tax=Molossus molossus TaxID=27622 RepID=A0A7J8JW57_MOLMO|nr:hypothetical protein HJG59_008048 [Molossus molossus]